MKQYNVLELSGFQEAHKQRLPEGVQVIYSNAKSISRKQIAEADIIIGRPPIELLPYAENLKWLQLDSAGSEQYASEGVLRKDVLLSNATGCFGGVIAEYLLCTILMLMRNMNKYIRNQEAGRWQVEGPISSIAGSTFLVVGMGNLGSEFARRIHALGGKVLGIRKHPEAAVEGVSAMYSMDHLEELLPKADVVVLTLPSTLETRRMFRREYFTLMKKTAIVANVGRGDVLYTDDLLEAIQNKELAGAILDVCDQEPLPYNHPLWKEENVIITPHISGTFQLPATYELFVDFAIENLHAYLEGKSIRNIVDRKSGYRSFADADR